MEALDKNALRSRVVTFRLTEDEYDWLKNLCDETGSSISDTARSTVLASAEAVATSRSPLVKLDGVDQKLDQIIALLEALPSRRIESPGHAARCTENELPQNDSLRKR